MAVTNRHGFRLAWAQYLWRIECIYVHNHEYILFYAAKIMCFFEICKFACTSVQGNGLKPQFCNLGDCNFEIRPLTEVKNDAK